jgi:hypothetical protein
MMKNMTNGQNGAARKPVYEKSEDCGSLHISGSDQGTMSASGLQTVFSITHPDRSITQDGAGAITVLEMHAIFS